MNQAVNFLPPPNINLLAQKGNSTPENKPNFPPPPKLDLLKPKTPGK